MGLLAQVGRTNGPFASTRAWELPFLGERSGLVFASRKRTMSDETRAVGAGKRTVGVVAVFAMFALVVSFAQPVGAAANTCGGLAATIVGTDSADVIYGTEGVDVIVGLGGADRIYGLGGNDVICGGPGPDRIWGGTGNDRMWGNGGNDRIQGALGKDRIFGGNGQDILSGQAGADRILGNSGRDKLVGGKGDDVLIGGSGADRLFGREGDDKVRGGPGNDLCDSPGDTLIDCELPLVSGPPLSGAYTAEMFTLINAERTARGLPVLTRHPDLDSYAAAWAVEMAKFPLPLNAANHHSPPFNGSSYPFQGIPESVAWTTAFENVGYSTVGPAETPADVIDRLFYTPGGGGFMSSPGHKCNILETAANQVGLGAYVDSNGDAWVVQVFWGSQWPVPNPTAECVGVVSR